MMTQNETAASLRSTVLQILSGHMPPDEDTTLFAVLSVEALDPEWLLTQLAEQRYPMPGRIEVLYNTSSTFERGLEILCREDPTLGPVRTQVTASPDELT